MRLAVASLLGLRNLRKEGLDSRNRNLGTVVVCPLTTMLRPHWRMRLHVTVAGMPADICADQIRTISKTRLTTKLDALSQSDALALRELLSEMYGKP